ncbi:MAG TPA: putative metalloprotease CJM1_0395 family protein [Polyangiales bacterium]|nr:putative metalloprotease CJM1_0395 family protein [Polyangiales bacterium]
MSHAVSAGALRSRVPESGKDRAQLSAASDALGPAVVNHVRRPGEVDGSAGPEDSQASPEKVEDSEKTEEARKLQARDSEVRAHERAHAAAGGALAGAPSYTFERGPDGRSYAVSGEVSIDVSEVSNDAQATVRKMQQVKRAALAPQSPSDADRAIAAMADAKITAARLELSITGSHEQPEEQSSTHTANAPMAGDAAHRAFGMHEHRNAAAAAYRTASVPAPGNGINVVS